MKKKKGEGVCAERKATVSEGIKNDSQGSESAIMSILAIY